MGCAFFSRLAFDIFLTFVALEEIPTWAGRPTEVHYEIAIEMTIWKPPQP
jgi:hypothetical protein